jgi:hypothetical protein
MSRKSLGVILIVLGILVGVVSLAADAIGLGSNQGVTGWKQMLGAAAGLLAIVAGVWFLVRKPAAK